MKIEDVIYTNSAIKCNNEEEWKAIFKMIDHYQSPFFDKEHPYVLLCEEGGSACEDFVLGDHKNNRTIKYSVYYASEFINNIEPESLTIQESLDFLNEQLTKL